MILYVELGHGPRCPFAMRCAIINGWAVNRSSRRRSLGSSRRRSMRGIFRAGVVWITGHREGNRCTAHKGASFNCFAQTWHHCPQKSLCDMCSMLRSPKILTATFFGLTHGKVRGDFWMPSCIQTGGLRGNRLYRAALVSLAACACAYYDFKIDAVFILFAICRFTRAARLRLASEHRPAPFFLLLQSFTGHWDTRVNETKPFFRRKYPSITSEFFLGYSYTLVLYSIAFLGPELFYSLRYELISWLKAAWCKNSKFHLSFIKWIHHANFIIFGLYMIYISHT